MGILNNNNIITGIKNVKQLPTNRGLHFQKNKPMTPYNYPLSQRTLYRIYGYKIDKFSGIKRPHWIKAELATGKQLTPQTVGLDGFYKIEIIKQTGMVSPRVEKKNLDHYRVPEEPNEESDTFKYNENVINNRGYLKQNVKRQP